MSYHQHYVNGVGVVVQWVKLPLATPACHIATQVQVLASLRPIQLPDTAPRKAEVGILPPTGDQDGVWLGLVPPGEAI